MSGLKIIKNSSFKDNRGFYWTTWKKGSFQKLKFNHERFKKFAERIIFSNYSIELPKDIQERCSNLINERLNTDGPWGNVPKSLDTVERMIETADSKEDVTLLKEVKASIEKKLSQIKTEA